MPTKFLFALSCVLSHSVLCILVFGIDITVSHCFLIFFLCAVMPELHSQLESMNTEKLKDLMLKIYLIFSKLTPWTHFGPLQCFFSILNFMALSYTKIIFTIYCWWNFSVGELTKNNEILIQIKGININA